MLALLAALACKTADDTAPVGCPEPFVADALWRGPYLQRVGADRATVAFGGPDADATVTIDGVSSPTTRGALYEDRILHHAELSGLEGGEHCYTVASGGETLAAGSFHTAPGPDATIRLHAIGDMGTGFASQLAVRDQMEARPADVLVTLGDNAYPDGTPDQLQRYVFDVYREMFAKTPLFTTQGNHDYRTDEAAPYYDSFFLPENAANPAHVERYWSADWGPVHLVGLDSDHADAQLEGGLLDWLRADLAATDRPWTIAMWHHPVHTVAPGRDAHATMRDHVVPVLEEAGVPLVLVGHDHHYARWKPMKGEVVDPAGVVHVTSGGGGQLLYGVEDDERVEVALKSFEFLELTVSPCAIEGRAIDDAGAEIDGFTLSRCP